MRRALALASLLVLNFAGAQLPTAPQTPQTPPDWLVQTVIPNALTVRVPKAGLSFAIDSLNYPPQAFPAQYPAQPFPVDVFVNTPGTWNLQVQLRDIRDDNGVLLIPVSHILFRVDGGPWLRANGTPQVIWTQRGATVGWQRVPVEFTLELDGSEQGGSYNTHATFSAIVLP